MLPTSDVNGITALSLDGPAPYSAALVVGVGARDETVRTLGVTHLVEHLVMAAQPRTALDTNAMVDDVITVFHATGGREAVTEHLARVCTAIRDLPLDRLEIEAKVLDAEDGHSVHPALAWSAGLRFGAGGTGLLGMSGPPHQALSREHVREHVRRYFTAGNAVVVATGELPRHPDIRLHDGARVPPQVADESSLCLPAYLAGPPDPVLSWVAQRGAGSEVLVGLLIDGLTDDLRHRQGLVYEIDFGTTPIDEHRTLVTIWGDGESSKQQEILAVGVEALRRLAERGPSDEDLAHQHALARARMTDPRGTLEYLILSAFRHLEGRSLLTVEQHVRESEEVTAADVRAAAAHALPTLLLGGSDPAPDGVAGIPDRTEDKEPDSPLVEGRRWRRKLVSMAPRDLRVDANDEAIAVTVLGERHGGRWVDLVGVAAGPWFRVLIFRDGGAVPVLHQGIKDADTLFSEIDSRAGALLFEVDETWLPDDD